MRPSTEVTGTGAGTGAQHTPAWKRLGLKLKQPTAASEPANDSPPAVGHPAGVRPTGKRKFDDPAAPESCSLDIKKSRREGPSKDRNALPPPKAKTVSFGDAPAPNGKAPSAVADNSTPFQEKPRPQKKKAKGPEKKKKPAPPIDLKPALDYLCLWKTSRDSWKFNKNHQTALIKHLFDPEKISSADIDTLYDYIRDLKGFVRTRLRETAMEMRTKDVSDGSAAFPAGTPDLAAKQVSYEKLLKDLLHKRSAGRKRKNFDEVGFAGSAQDIDAVILRVVKRMRAELVLDELDDEEETDDSQSSKSSETAVTSDSEPSVAPGVDKRVRLNDGTPKRRRKLRVNKDDDSSSSSSSSSESESESEADSSSDSSSSDESDDSDEEEEEAAEGYVSSSSSSSSSSDSDSDDDDDSDEDEGD